MKNSRLVYSTDSGRDCPQCGQRLDKCKCSAETSQAPSDGVVRIHRQTKGRKGKGVSLITGLALGEKALKTLAKKLKAQCGVGGTVKDGVIEIQTDDRDRLKHLLEKQGRLVKLAGG